MISILLLFNCGAKMETMRKVISQVGNHLWKIFVGERKVGIQKKPEGHTVNTVKTFRLQ